MFQAWIYYNNINIVSLSLLLRELIPATKFKDFSFGGIDKNLCQNFLSKLR